MLAARLDPATSASSATSVLRLAVSADGLALGIVEVPPGGPARLLPSGSGEAQTRLRKLVDELAAHDTITVTVDTPSANGNRAYDANEWKRGAPNYGDGVSTKLVEAGFKVERLR